MRGGDGGGSEEQRPQQASAEMEDMMEQMLSMASWSDAQAGGGGARMHQWAAGADYSNIAGLESMVALLNTSNGPVAAAASAGHPLLDPEGSIVVNGAMAAIKSASSSDSRSWQEGVYGAGAAALNFGSTKATSDTAAAAALMLGKRIRDQEHPAGSMISGISTGGQAEAIFSGYTGPQVGHIQGSIARTTSTGRGSNAQFTQALRTAPTTTTTTATSDSDQQQQQQQALGTSQEAVSQQQPAGRPRVRARRGQATDPHSIAERLRRERIAERMKSLQELVPNANKTDKASMLDEIIDYVKFLQLQVKVLSMSRLGNAGAVSSFMADLPAEESNKFLTALSKNGGSAAQLQQEGGVSLTERQVAKLMEEDMGSAMQYLQSKGLCLMPIHLAGNMSTKAAAGGGGSIMDPKKPTAPLPVAAAGTSGIAGSASASRASKFEDSSTNYNCKAEQRPESQQH